MYTTRRRRTLGQPSWKNFVPRFGRYGRRPRKSGSLKIAAGNWIGIPIPVKWRRLRIFLKVLRKIRFSKICAPFDRKGPPFRSLGAQISIDFLQQAANPPSQRETPIRREGAFIFGKILTLKIFAGTREFSRAQPGRIKNPDCLWKISCKIYLEPIRNKISGLKNSGTRISSVRGDPGRCVAYASCTSTRTLPRGLQGSCLKSKNCVCGPSGRNIFQKCVCGPSGSKIFHAKY